MKYKKLLSLGSLALLLGFAGCRPGGAENVSELDVVGTIYSPQANFKNYKTYAMSDSIVQVNSDYVDGTTVTKPTYVKQSTANLICQQIDYNMQKLGYKKVNKNQSPDVYIQNAAMQTTQVYYYYSYYYTGYYYPYGGWYYPGYYPPTYTTTQTGTLLMQMIDGKQTDVSGNAPVWWLGVINGLMTGTSQSTVITDINQAFTQSPYLQNY